MFGSFPILEYAQQILTPIAIILVLSNAPKVYHFLTTKTPKSKQQRPVTSYDTLSHYLLLISIFGYLIAAVYTQNNVFELVGVDTDANSYHIRQKFNEYIYKQ